MDAFAASQWTDCGRTGGRGFFNRTFSVCPSLSIYVPCASALVRAGVSDTRRLVTSSAYLRILAMAKFWRARKYHRHPTSGLVVCLLLFFFSNVPLGRRHFWPVATPRHSLSCFYYYFFFGISQRRPFPARRRPVAGSMTELRGIIICSFLPVFFFFHNFSWFPGKKANQHMRKEWRTLCETIYDCGYRFPDGTAIIRFGDLFNVMK